MENVDQIDIRMYKIGTGDCLVLKFFSNQRKVFTMMIDGGTWSGGKKKLTKFVNNIKDFVDNELDLLVITHEHLDHVHLFDVCFDMFNTDFVIGEIWMGWTEEDEDSKVQKWKKENGKKKIALSRATKKIGDSFENENFNQHFEKSFKGKEIIGLYSKVSKELENFNRLHFSIDKEKTYVGGLKGMENIKKKLANNNIKYLRQGETLSIPKVGGINFHILGPPNKLEEVHKEKGKKGGNETFEHNKVLKKVDSFALAVNGNSNQGANVFDSKYTSDSEFVKNYYGDEGEVWRKIDYDWLIGGATNLALRLNSGINNLSLALAIEVEKSGQVLLFPGDAEIGSWESWHEIEWGFEGKDNKHFTEDLLNRVVFYKVAHHLSHNGTAKEKGLEMMTSKNLVSMATLDFDVISSGWKSTMPNRALLKELIRKTRGKLIIMNDKNMYLDFNQKEPLKDVILKERKRMNSQEKKDFDSNYVEDDLFHQYSLHLN